ncbi:MAG: TIGR00730 family Rossman fold protein [Bacteroidales bacterium]|jgi:uncharacterized protein (TIGR00730 family)|nr:TIGR00730 family Rossman fold protein [Bacteroidales bacterium]
MMTNKLKSVGIFCGSRKGNNSTFEQAATELGKIMAAENIRLVYGGGGIGLMQSIADAVLENNGMVTGVLPHFLDKQELGHSGVTEMIMVSSMGERKEKMAELSDAFIALPGGFGTLDELFEMLTYSQLTLHNKPIGILNTNRFYDPLIQQIERMQKDGFLHEKHQQMLIVADRPADLLKRIKLFWQA